MLNDRPMTDELNNLSSFEDSAVKKIPEHGLLVSQIVEAANSGSGFGSFEFVVKNNTPDHTRFPTTPIPSPKSSFPIDSLRDSLTTDSAMPAASALHRGIPSSQTSQKTHKPLISDLNSDLNSYMTSLKDGNSVSSTTVERVLTVFSVPQFRAVDHTFAAIHDLKKFKDKSLLSIKPEVHTIVLPLLWESH